MTPPTNLKRRWSDLTYGDYLRKQGWTVNGTYNGLTILLDHLPVVVSGTADNPDLAHAGRPAYHTVPNSTTDTESYVQDARELVGVLVAIRDRRSA